LGLLLPTIAIAPARAQPTSSTGDLMRYRSGLTLAVLVAAACSVGTDNPVAPDIAPAFEEGVKPPPPLGSGDVEITLYSPDSETPFSDLRIGGPSASALENQPFYAQVHGRYFSNTQFTNGWISFESDECVTASPDARLQYNEKTGKTHGHGTLTNCDGVTIDLSKIEITSGGFGDCELNYGEYSCRSFSFSYNGTPGGNVYVGPGE
jgi:hypothetical protein